jgi:hypothetical protein
MASNSEREALIGRQDAYKRLFKGPIAAKVLADLAWFCRAEQSTFHADPRAHALLEGRREVWLRIQEHLNLDTDDLLRRRALPPIAAE